MVCLFVCFVIACHCKITAYVGDNKLIPILCKLFYLILFRIGYPVLVTLIKIFLYVAYALSGHSLFPLLLCYIIRYRIGLAKNVFRHMKKLLTTTQSISMSKLTATGEMMQRYCTGVKVGLLETK